MEARWKYKPFPVQFQAKPTIPRKDSSVFLNLVPFRLKYRLREGLDGKESTYYNDQVNLDLTVKQLRGKINLIFSGRRQGLIDLMMALIQIKNVIRIHRISVFSF